MLSGVLLTQTLVTGGGSEGDAQAVIIDLANDILNKVPNEFDIDFVSAQYPVMYTNSMNTVLKQVSLSLIITKIYAHTPLTMLKGIYFFFV